MYKFYAALTDPLFDLSYGTDTGGWARLEDLTIQSRNKGRGILYQATRVKPLRELFKSIASIVSPGSVLVDFGCGKGRVLMVAATCGFERVVGVEFASELCEIAKKNCEIYKHRTGVKTEFQIVEIDAAEYRVQTEENVFFLFHPFDDVVLKELLGNIVSSLVKQPRKILIIYNNPEHGKIIEQQTGLTQIRDSVLCGSHFTLYSNGDPVGLGITGA